MPVTYDYYRIFYHVVQCRSFTRAAEALHNNQPNITRCMNNLEQELGCKLFVRSNRGISLTPEGKRLYRRVSVAFEQLQLGEDEIRRDCSLDTGTISIAASENPMQVDCAVITTPASQTPSLRVTPLVSFRDVLLCGTEYRALAERPRRLRELANCSFICLGSGTSTYDFYQRLFTRHKLPFRVDLEAATTTQVLSMVRYNLGVAFYPETMAQAALARGEVLHVPLIEPIAERTVCLVEDAVHPQSVAMKALRRHLCKDLS